MTNTNTIWINWCSTVTKGTCIIYSTYFLLIRYITIGPMDQREKYFIKKILGNENRNILKWRFQALLVYNKDRTFVPFHMKLSENAFLFHASFYASLLSNPNLSKLTAIQLVPLQNLNSSKFLPWKFVRKLRPCLLKKCQNNFYMEFFEVVQRNRYFYTWLLPYFFALLRE